MKAFSGREFQCFDKSKFIPISSVNDDFCDCVDGSDEPGAFDTLHLHHVCGVTEAPSATLLIIQERLRVQIEIFIAPMSDIFQRTYFPRG